MKMNKHFYAGTLFIVFITILMVGCVKIPSEAPPLPDFEASMRIFNAMAGEVSVSVDGVNKATLASGAVSGYMTVTPGNRVFKLANAEAETLFVDTDFVGTIFVKAKAGEYSKMFSKNRERWLYTDHSLEDSTARITVAQLTPDAVSVIIENADLGVEETLGGDLGTVNRTTLPMGVYAVTMTAGGDTVRTRTEELGNMADRTLVVMGASNNPTVKTMENE